jgi:hypothetical protein
MPVRFQALRARAAMRPAPGESLDPAGAADLLAW